MIELQACALRLSLVYKYLNDPRNDVPHIAKLLEHNFMIEKDLVATYEAPIKALTSLLEKKISDTSPFLHLHENKGRKTDGERVAAALEAIAEDCQKAKTMKKLESSRNSIAIIEQSAKDFFTSYDKIPVLMKQKLPQLDDALLRHMPNSFLEDSSLKLTPIAGTSLDYPEPAELSQCCREVVDKVKGAVIKSCIPGILVDSETLSTSLATYTRKEITEYLSEQR